MAFPLTLIFIILSFIAFSVGSSIIQLKNQSKFLPLVGIFLILIVTFRPEGMPDFSEYQRWFFNPEAEGRAEPAYDFLQKSIKRLTDQFRVLTFIMACISVSLNLYAIKKFANFIYLSLIFYLANLFILHDMIQIRCAVAASIFLFAIPYIFKRDFKRFIFIIILCTCFHYSSLALIPLYFVRGFSINKLLYASLIPAAYVLYLLNIRLGYFIELIPLPFIQNLWQMYQAIMESKGEMHFDVFQNFQLVRCLICFILIFFSDSIKEKNKYFILWLKIYIYSLVAFVLFSDIPVVAQRISELFQTVEFLMFPMLMYLPFKNSLLIKKVWIVGLAGIIYFWTAFYSKLLI